MSKNTNLSGFRKIDIDKYDPENYQDDEPNQGADEGGPNEMEVINLLNRYKLGLNQHFFLSLLKQIYLLVKEMLMH